MLYFALVDKPRVEFPQSYSGSDLTMVTLSKWMSDSTNNM